MIADYHLHSNSPDAGQDMKNMCQAAVNKGIDEIVITDHYEFYSGGKVSEYFHKDYLDKYIDDLEMCQELFAGRLTVKTGMELGQGYLEPDKQQKIIESYPFDYLIGSLHKIQNVDMGNLVYSEETLDSIAETYYDQLIEMTRDIEFDCLGHIDLITRYMDRAGYGIDIDRYLDKISQILINVITQNKGIEINTSTLRQGMAESMPGLKILKLYKELGGKIITVGSDAHRPADVGVDIEKAYEQLRIAGFTSYAIYNKRNYSFVGLD